MALSLPIINDLITEKIDKLNTLINYIENRESSYKNDIINELNLLKDTVKLQEYEIKCLRNNYITNICDDNIPPGLPVPNKNITPSMSIIKPILLDTSTQTDNLIKEHTQTKTQTKKKTYSKDNWTVVTRKKTRFSR